MASQNPIPMIPAISVLLTQAIVLPSQVKMTRQVGQFFPFFKLESSITSKFTCYNFTFGNSSVITVWLQKTDNPDEIYGIDGFVSSVMKPDDVSSCEVTADIDTVKFAPVSGSSFVDSFILMGHSTGLEMANSSDLYKCKVTRLEDNSSAGMDFYFSYGLTGRFMDGNAMQQYVYLYNSTCIYKKFIDFSADNDLIPLAAGTYNFLTSYNVANLTSNYTRLCIGKNASMCTNFDCPNVTTVEDGWSVIQSQSVVHGFDNNYTKREVINLNKADTMNSIYRIQQQCVRFQGSSGRSVYIKGPDDVTAPSSVVDLFRIQLRYLDGDATKAQTFLSGWVCAEDLAIFPVTALTEKDAALVRYCKKSQQAAAGSVDALIYTSIEETCKNVIFLQGYTRIMTLLFCVFCAVFQVVWIYAKRDYKRKTKVQKRRFMIKLIIIVLNIITFIVLMLAYSSGAALLCIPPVVLWFVELFWEACDGSEFEREEVASNMFKAVFACKKFRFADISQILLLWIINLIFAAADAVLLMADICQFLQFMKFDIDRIMGTILLQPSLALTKLADSLLTSFKGAEFIMMLIFFVILQVLMSLLRSNFMWVKVLQRKIKRDQVGKAPQPFGDQRANAVEGVTETLVGDGKAAKHGIIDWSMVSFVIIPVRLLALYQNFLQLLLGESYMFMFYKGERGGPSPFQVFLMVFISSYFYMLTKFNMLVSWLTGVYVLVMQVALNVALIFTRVSQAVVSTLLCVLTAPFFSMLNPTGVSFSQALHHSLFAALVAVVQFAFTALEIASFFLYPLFIMFSDFLPPFDFAMTALGVVPPQVRIVENANRMHVEGAVDAILRVLICGIAYWLIGIFTITQQDVEVWKSSAVYAVLFLIIPFVRYQYDGQRSANYLISQKMALPDLRQNVYNRVIQAYNGFTDFILSFKLKYNAHQYLQKISADYEHPEGAFGDLLINQMLICYGFVPVIGPIVGIFANFMNEPSLQTAGKTELTMAFFLNILHFATILIAMLMIVWSTGKGYIAFIVIYFILAAVDALDETSDSVEGAGRIQLVSLCPCLRGLIGKCKARQEQNKKQMEEERKTMQETEALRLQMIRLKTQSGNMVYAGRSEVDGLGGGMDLSLPMEAGNSTALSRSALVPAVSKDKLE